MSGLAEGGGPGVPGVWFPGCRLGWEEVGRQAPVCVVCEARRVARGWCPQAADAGRVPSAGRPPPSPQGL